MFETLPRDVLLHRPQRGWIRDIREAIGMSASDLAVRLGVSRPSVSQMERDEVSGSITLKRLERAADALGCSLGYVLLPRLPLDQTVRTRAREVASRVLNQVDQTMALEAQSTDAEERNRLVEDFAADLVREGRNLWKDQP
jgi:predicted DNA-binding mobile mystery protein A